MGRKIEDELAVVERFTGPGLETMIDIANSLGTTRQAVWHCLHRHGVKTPKTSQIKVSCTMCGKQIMRCRKEVRVRKHLFCDDVCYFNWLDRGLGLGSKETRYIDSRKGRREAKKVVAQYFDLQPEHIVHHEDRNADNNDPRNLRVFGGHGDHVRHHRGFIVPILWDGRYEATKKNLNKRVVDQLAAAKNRGT